MVDVTLQVKVGDGLQRGDGDRSAQRSLHDAAHADRAERRIILPGCGLQMTTDPAGGDGFFAGCATLHVIHRVEVGMGRVGRPDSVDDGQSFFVPQIFERSQGRMQPEEAIQVDAGLIVAR